MRVHMRSFPGVSNPFKVSERLFGGKVRHEYEFADVALQTVCSGDPSPAVLNML